MSDLGKPGAMTGFVEKTYGDVFEDIIRVYGVTAACEWFGHKPDSEFTAETIRILVQRSEESRA